MREASDVNVWPQLFERKEKRGTRRVFHVIARDAHCSQALLRTPSHSLAFRLAQQQAELRRKKSGFKGTAGREPDGAERIHAGAASIDGGAGSKSGDGVQSARRGENATGSGDEIEAGEGKREVQEDGQGAGGERRRQGRRRMGEEQRRVRPSRRSRKESTEGGGGEEVGDEEDAEKLLPADVVAQLVERNKEER